MKCYKLVLIILLNLLAFSGFAKVYELLPLGEKTISPGDLTTIQVVSEINERIPNLQGERLAGIFYVLKQNGDRLEVIIAPPETPSELRSSGENKFIPKGFEYKHKKNAPLPDFLIQEKSYSYGASWYYWVGVGVLLLLALMALVWKKIRNKKKLRDEKKAHLAKLEEYLKGISNAQTRKEIEAIYAYRREIEENFEFNKAHYEDFIKSLSSVQYKRDWSPEDSASVGATLQAFRKGLRIKSGI